MPRKQRFSPRQFGSAMRRGGITLTRLVTAGLIGAVLGGVVGAVVLALMESPPAALGFISGFAFSGVIIGLAMAVLIGAELNEEPDQTRR